MQESGRGHCHAAAFQLAVVDLILVCRFTQLWPDIFRLKQVIQFIIDYLRDHFHNSDVLREVLDAIDIDVDSLLFSLFPELSGGILLLVVRDELRSVLTVRVGIQNREVDLSVGTRTRVSIQISKADWWSEKSFSVSAEPNLAINLKKIMHEVAQRCHLAALLVLGKALHEQ